MKTYSQIRGQINTGDVFLTSTGLLGWFVRLLTVESYSHVAMCHWEGDAGLWVSEMRGRYGHNAMPASEWIQLNPTFTWGTCPPAVKTNPGAIVEFVRKYRVDDPSYSYWALFLVWVSQLTGWQVGPLGNVCSTYVERAWAHAGYQAMLTAADPGDFRKHCGACHFIEG